MSNQRTTFAKRQREQNRKDKLKAKQDRLAARRANPRTEKGPPMGLAEPPFDGDPTNGVQTNGQHVDGNDDRPFDGPPAPGDDQPTD